VEKQLEASVVRRPKLNVPKAEGVPDSTPAGDSVRPGGRAPEVTAKTYGETLPLAVRL